MVRYHGVLSSHAKLRSEVVPKLDENAPKQLALFEHDKTVLAPEPRRKPWAWLLRHVFSIDVVTCVRCARGFDGNDKMDHCAHIGLLRDVFKVYIEKRWNSPKGYAAKKESGKKAGSKKSTAAASKSAEKKKKRTARREKKRK